MLREWPASESKAAPTITALEEEAGTTIPSHIASMQRCTDDYPPATKRVFRSPEEAILLELRAAKAHTIA
jgi:hypothetical protein